MHRRWSEEHPLEVYVPNGTINELLLLSDTEPPEVKSSKFVDVRVSFRNTDKKYLQKYVLLNDDYLSVFKCFYDDVFEYTKHADPRNGAEVIAERFTAWKNLFSPLPRGLKENEIQGLIGELITLEEMIEKRGEKESVVAWMVAKLGKRDFVFSEEWMEVKTILSGVPTVKISSVEQLDTQYNGILRIITLEKTSVNNEKRLTLNIMCERILNSLKHESNRCVFRDIMQDKYKCPGQQYDAYSYVFVKSEDYRVNEKFPRIRRKDLGDAIAGVKYEITINMLPEFRI